MRLAHKTGAALVEILLAMMIMSIGLFMVISIFPIAVKRSVQSSQLTNARLVKEQAEQLLRIVPGLTPDFTVLDALSEANDASANYSTLDNVFLNKNKTANTVGTTRLRVIDPLGFYHLQDAAGSKTHLVFGNNNNSPDAAGVGVIRVPGNLKTNSTPANFLSWEQAQDIMLNKDSWQSNKEDTPDYTGANPTSLSLIKFNDDMRSLLTEFTNPSANFLSTATSTSVPYKFQALGRIEIFSSDFKKTQTRPFFSNDINTTDNTISLTPGLPADGSFAQIPRVIIQVLDQRYSWIFTYKATLNNLGADTIAATADDSLTISGEIVVFFRRPITPLNEQIHGISNINGKAVEINWKVEKPTIKNGIAIYDLKNGNWYKIRSVESINDSNATAKVTLDRDVVDSFADALIMESVIEIFPTPSFTR